MATTLETALHLHKAGLTLVRILTDGTKRPADKYADLLHGEVKQTEQDIRNLFGSGREWGIGILTGACSGNFEAIDIDDPSIVDKFKSLIPRELRDKLCEHRSPRKGGGRHFLYRTTETHKKGGLAYRLEKTKAATDPVDIDGKKIEFSIGTTSWKVRIETTNYIIAPGSAHGTHPNGDYKHVGGPDMLNLEVLTEEERDVLMWVSAQFDERPEQKNTAGRIRESSKLIRSVGDDFIQRADWGWILGDLMGCTLVETRENGCQLWRRPGKENGVSCQVGGGVSKYGNSQLYIHSTNMYPFEAKRSYNKLGAYMLAKYGNMSPESWKKAIPELAKLGYGPEPVTELAMAEKVAAECGQDVLWVDEFKKFLIWDETHYHDACISDVQTRIVDTIRRLGGEDKESQTVVRAFSSNRKIGAVKTLLKGVADIRARPEEFDLQPMLFNCQNGTIDLGDGMEGFREAKQDDRLTRVAPFEFDPKATCPVFDKFIREIMCDDDDLVGYMQTLTGYFLTGEVFENILPIFYGHGQNGKGAFIRVIEKVLGIGPSGYAGKVNANLILRNRQVSHPTEWTALLGRRFVSIEETDDSKKLNESAVKSITGGDTINARYCGGDPFEFQPTHKIVLATNHKPDVEGTDLGVWRRLKLIPFNFTVGEKDPTLEYKLASELPGIFNWALRGCQHWSLFGFSGEPSAVQYATREYREEADIFGQWLSESCDTGPECSVAVATLYDSYERFLFDNRRQPITRIKFGRELKRRCASVREGRTREARLYEGIGLKEAVDERF